MMQEHSERRRLAPAHNFIRQSRFGSCPEDELIREARSGSQAAFEELIARSGDTCMRVIRCLVRNEDDAQDEFQNAYSRAYEHLKTFNQDAKFSTWVVRIAINSCVARRKQVRRAQLIPYTVTDYEGKTHSPYDSVECSPEGDFGKRQVSQTVKQELDRIPPLLRLPLELRFLKDLPIEEIARTLGITVAATKSRLHRGRSFLRERMLRHCGQRGAGTLTRY
ncbi:MAG TPA: sigma-70 family RNA polymerase sigma factor [Bryobacteraceae bacterium]|jgi:RNA polymerase sigma-70 factor (ECF subfamily)